MKSITLFFVLAVLGAPLFSLSLEELTGQERAAALTAQDAPLTEVQLKNPRPRLLPRHEELQKLIAGITGSLEPGLFVETLYRCEKPAAGTWTEAEQAELFNHALALSTLAGIQYYSASRKAMRTFYESSRVIDSPSGKKILSDPMYETPPDTLTLYARQKDLTFGDNIYRYDYHVMPDAFVFVQENLTAMNAGIIPAIGKNKLRSVMAVIDTEDCLLIYAAAMAKAASLPGLGERIGNSFTNRAAAILKWYTAGIEGIFGR
jgi:hypothetical protein